MLLNEIFLGFSQCYSAGFHFWVTITISCSSLCHILLPFKMLLTLILSDSSCLQEALCSFLYLIPLVVLQFAEIIWIANLPSVALAILFLHNIVLNSITQIINENSNWVEYGVDTHLPLQTFSQLTPKHWWILFCEQFLNQLWKLFSWFTCTMHFLGI